jgi:hypothetical protein
LDATVDQQPRCLGQHTSTWTRRSLQGYLAQRLKVTVAECTLGRHLRRLGWTLVRPALTVSSPDPAYAVKAAELAVLKAQARRGQITLLFVDEIDLNLLPGVWRCWTRVGEQRRVPTPGTNQKRYGFGAVHFSEGSLVTHLGDRKNSAGFCRLLEAIVACYCPGPVWEGPKVVLVVDNYIVHKSKITQQTLAKYADRLECFHLPTYSPKLNLIEWLWKYLRSKVTHNHLFTSIEELLTAVQQFLVDLAADRTLVLSIIGNQPNHQTHLTPKNLCSVN